MNPIHKALIIFAIVIIIALMANYAFLRKDKRHIPYNNSLFVSPANGTITSIRSYNEATIIETKNTPAGEQGAIEVLTADVAPAGTIITITLGLADIHRLRAPMGGKVISVTHTPGNHADALQMPNGIDFRYQNEHTEFLIQYPPLRGGQGGLYKVVMIAGFAARDIVPLVKPGDTITQGQWLGYFKLGSQVTFILPEGLNLKAKLGAYVLDGETVLAKVGS